ncbi:MAG: hypothetical protein IJ802_05135 [Kiritimatiellae bacterium]|nr:hypothetical protein [Kiritimatiellia bacterium]
MGEAIKIDMSSGRAGGIAGSPYNTNKSSKPPAAQQQPVEQGVQEVIVQEVAQDEPKAIDEVAGMRPAENVPQNTQKYINQLESEKQALSKRNRSLSAQIAREKKRRTELWSKSKAEMIELLIAAETKVVDYEQCKKDCEEAEKKQKEAEGEAAALAEQKRICEEEKKQLKGEIASLQGELESEKQRNVELVQKNSELMAESNYCTDMMERFIPKCLQQQQWWTDNGFADRLRAPREDAEMLLFASLAEFAAMERNAGAPTFGWEKQICDIGKVLANWLHELKQDDGTAAVQETQVVQYMREFAGALAGCPAVAAKGIRIIVPNIGGGYNTNQVHNRSGMGAPVTRIINWCVESNGSVYAVAEVQ